MYDALTTRYSFSCPHRGRASVLLSGFRRLEQLPGPHHPAIYQVEFACGCGDLHTGLVPQDELDWAPLGLDEHTCFVNFMTARRDPLSTELGDLAAQRIKAGQWPWSFFCWPEGRPRVAYPSAFWLLAAAGRDEQVAVAVHCPSCARLSVNLVSREHVDLPFHNDRAVGVLTQLFDDQAGQPLDRLALDPAGSLFEPRLLAA